MYYDGKLKLKLSIDFTKWTEVYSECDRYFWTGLKEKIISNVCYIHFYTFSDMEFVERYGIQRGANDATKSDAICYKVGCHKVGLV